MEATQYENQPLCRAKKFSIKPDKNSQKTYIVDWSQNWRTLA